MWIKANFDGIMPELKMVSNWVLAKPLPRDGKIAKVPFQPSGKVASSTDPRTWSAFEEVLTAHRRGGFPFIGFVLDGQPHFDGRYLHGFDFDKCIINGKIDARVGEILTKISLPREEVSVSGTGVRGFFFHEECLPNKKVHIEGRSVEMYSDKRYLTTTGVRLER